MSYTVSFSPLTAADYEPAARLIHRSLADWYERNLRQGGRYAGGHAPFLLFARVYEALDPGECVVARDCQSGELLGLCFSHERDTHVGVGIVVIAPETAGQGIARRMVETVLEKARNLGKPARLVSSLLNLDSFSLYTRTGFVPGTIFQDMVMAVPETGMAVPAPSVADRVRLARVDEAARIADFELSQQGIRRQKDYEFFLRNEVGSWRVLLAERTDGSLCGFLGLSAHSSFGMIGPGVSADEETAAALLWHALDGCGGRTILFLVPCTATSLVRTAYRWGARNTELHVMQSTAGVPFSGGIVFPTFLPESG
jgi:GNAT superfamily N-acetyltransferase